MVHYTLTKTLGRISAPVMWLIAISLVILSGIGYRVLASRLRLVVNTPINLPVPLDTLPVKIGHWTGTNVPVPENIRRITGNDDCLNRSYSNEATKQQVHVYVAYTARPRTMRGHRPQVCYVAGGWVHDSSDASEVVSSAGEKVPCLIHRFHKPAPDRSEIVVLNYYIANGRIINDKSVFAGVGWRTPNIHGDVARYVAQVQISSVSESSV